MEKKEIGEYKEDDFQKKLLELWCFLFVCAIDDLRSLYELFVILLF